MGKNWRQVKDEIEEEIDRIWWNEPEEVTMSKLGIFPSGAAVGNQIFGTLYWQVADTQGIGWSNAEPLMQQAFLDDSFTLDQCEKMWKFVTLHKVKLAGGQDPPFCPAPWFNLFKLKKFGEDIVDSFDSIKTKAEFQDLLWSWFSYVNCLNRWFFLIFPWHLGEFFPLITPEHIERLRKFSKVDLTKSG